MVIGESLSGTLNSFEKKLKNTQWYINYTIIYQLLKTNQTNSLPNYYFNKRLCYHVRDRDLGSILEFKQSNLSQVDID